MPIVEQTQVDLAEPQNENSTEPKMDSSGSLLGALDIVEAFTALRHEFKLQVRSGRELQQTVLENFQCIEEKLSSIPVHVNTSNQSDSRKMAEAIAEIEESLSRAIESISKLSQENRTESEAMQPFDKLVQSAPWLIRTFSKKWLQELRQSIADATTDEKQSDKSKDASFRGLELLLARVHRLMQQFAIQRENVLHKPFDPESMNAVDLVSDHQVPSGHVAQQIRPLYRWRDSILRVAEVRVSS
jgi:molecular chaperone GrpE